jgi:hypothetical protein
MAKGSYKATLAKLFADRYKPGATEVPFSKQDIEDVLTKHGDDVKNVADIIYNARYRGGLADAIKDVAPKGAAWIILPTGLATYAFVLARDAHITPNPDLEAIKVPDATPGVIRMYGQSDEQAALARVRYNRLIDMFLGVTAYSLQNHLRTQLDLIGQLEVDELYVGVGSRGTHFVIPVQAKRGSDKVGPVQMFQDLALCRERFPNLIPRAIAVYKMADETVALMEIDIVGGGKEWYDVKIVDERHYKLVNRAELTDEDLAKYRAAIG